MRVQPIFSLGHFLSEYGRHTCALNDALLGVWGSAWRWLSISEAFHADSLQRVLLFSRRTCRRSLSPPGLTPDHSHLYEISQSWKSGLSDSLALTRFRHTCSLFHGSRLFSTETFWGGGGALSACRAHTHCCICTNAIPHSSFISRDTDRQSSIFITYLTT